MACPATPRCAPARSPPRGRDLLHADTPTLWTAVVSTVIPAEPAPAAAAEITLMLLLTDQPPAYRSPIVADILTGEGWRNHADGQPLTTDDTGWLTGELFGRLDFLHLMAAPAMMGPHGASPQPDEA